MSAGTQRKKSDPSAAATSTNLTKVQATKIQTIWRDTVKAAQTDSTADRFQLVISALSQIDKTLTPSQKIFIDAPEHPKIVDPDEAIYKLGKLPGINPDFINALLKQAHLIREGTPESLAAAISVDKYPDGSNISAYGPSRGAIPSGDPTEHGGITNPQDSVGAGETEGSVTVSPLICPEAAKWLVDTEENDRQEIARLEKEIRDGESWVARMEADKDQIGIKNWKAYVQYYSSALGNARKQLEQDRAQAAEQCQREKKGR